MSMVNTEPISNTAAHANSQPMQSSRLLSLPRELQDMVIDTVESQQDLSALSKSCLELREAVLPFLFRNITLPGDQFIIHLRRTLSESREHSRFVDMIGTLKLHAITHRSHSSVLELIQSTPKLTRLELHYTIDQSAQADLYKDCISAAPLSSALTSVKDTLEHLKISYELTLINSTVALVVPVIGFCSLQQLHRLQTAHISFRALVGCDSQGPGLADVLPPSLRSLRFDDETCAMYVLDWDERLIMDKLVEYFGDEGWKQTTPQLKTVVLSLCGYNDVFDGRESPIWWADEGEREVKHLFADNELQFEVFRHQEHMSIPTEDDDTEDYV